ncbi:uncharacterized protein Z518_10197 [Rhinocladiella mackenziei CBS 650.93]|uniref:RING-14 protein n=1 Tax=Rhinocladiella mackenziei CBS 650.93 TaxID=1442369 RepID=A0A0D2ID21_9EURO|nr:uncharacterized protein Z518_10197 [Rhinocladiella mackenziei CBS 650.93]KIX01131.1 hypothetical protein Z518_10197 [Rhinocladiella mackenziei CBS 650.93]
MKFGQDFEAALARGEYPQEWIDSAISYKKLKKCIKQVQRELSGLGLDKETLDVLWQHVTSGPAEVGGKIADRLMQYSMDGSGKVSFTPKLTIAIDPHDGSPMDAWLSPETRRVLRHLARSSRANVDSEDEGPNGQLQCPIPDETNGASSNAAPDAPPDGENSHSLEDGKQQLETVEIPLSSDSEFFQILRRELTDLDRIRRAEQVQLQMEITQLGNELRALKASKSTRSKKEIAAWRKIFELYTEAEIFLSSHEVDAGARDADHAQKQFQKFTQSLASRESEVRKLGPDASVALDRFIRINAQLLRLMKFQEINKTALTKIIKKFDKRTALRAQASVSNSLVKSPFIVEDLAQATCFTISEEILNVIPQLNDYLCPICFSISYKPVRLRCNHVFCIRCLIVLQTRGQDRCPLCREEVVLEADSRNLDKQLMKFMKANFKPEVKEKQRYNEIQEGINRWGAQYENAQKCVVM